MLVRLMYASRAAEALRPDALNALLKQSMQRNAETGITGVLCHSGELFMQVVEGGRNPVNELYGRLLRDTRHHQVLLLSYEEIPERRFAGWAMGQVNLARLNPALLLKYSSMPELDPDKLTGRVALALFDELVATASVMCPN